MSGEVLSKAYPSIDFSPSQYSLNNQYTKFPPNTQDGRNVLQAWYPGSIPHEELLKQENIQSNWQYRKYMTSNGNEIRKEMLQNALRDVDYKTSAFSSPQPGGTQPISFESSSLSDLKSSYLTRKELQSKMVVPSLTQAQLLEQLQK
jgi:hypothetical protein